MKNLINLSIAGFLALTLSHCGNEGKGESAFGTEISAGGDSYAQEFTSVAHQVVNDLRENPIPAIDEEKLHAAVEATRVESKLELTLNGREVGAINYPESKRIELSRKHWDSISKEPPKKELLVLHEYLGISGVDDKNYDISSLADRSKVCNRNLKIREAIESSVKRQCNRITKYELQFVDLIDISDAAIDELRPADLMGLTKLNMLVLRNSGLKRIAPGTFEETPHLSSFFVLQPEPINCVAGMFKGIAKTAKYVGIEGPFMNVTAKVLEGIGGDTKSSIYLPFLPGSMQGDNVFEFLAGFEQAVLGNEEPDKEIPVGALRNASFRKVHLYYKKSPPSHSQFLELMENEKVKTVSMNQEHTILKDELNGKAGFECKVGGIMNYLECTRP